MDCCASRPIDVLSRIHFCFMASALVIPCHIRTKWDLKCLFRLLDSVREQTKVFSRVYVVDDASPLQYSLADHDVDHMLLEKNCGPARARNVAVTKALAAGHELIFFTDHDCILDRDWHSHMARYLADTNFAAAGGMTYSWGSTLWTATTKSTALWPGSGCSRIGENSGTCHP